MNGVTPDNDGNITLSASSVGAVGYAAPQSLTPAQQAQVRENINAPAPYTAGQNISISGTTIGTKTFPCNPNLLDNWYFGNPVNQRGQTNYTDDSPYSIDMLKLVHNMGLSVQSNGIVFSPVDKNDVAYATLFSGDSVITADVYGGTMSVLTADGNLYSQVVKNLPNRLLNIAEGVDFYFDGEKQYASVSVRLTSGATSPVILAVKLELSSEQTLAHQDADGKWVLNEIPDYGEQLRRCQRYCMVFPANKSMPCLAYPETDGWYLDAALWVGDMRATPANSLGSGIACKVRYIDGGDTVDETMTNWGLLGENTQCLRLAGTQIPSDKRTFPYIVVPQVDLVFSADL